MSELSSYSHFLFSCLSIFISDFFLFSCSVLSHPIHFCSFVVFLPYVLKLGSLLLPVLLPVSPLFFAFLAGLVHENVAQRRLCTLWIAYQSVLEKLQLDREVEDDAPFFVSKEDLELLEIVFGWCPVMGFEGNEFDEVLEKKIEDSEECGRADPHPVAPLPSLSRKKPEAGAGGGDYNHRVLKMENAPMWESDLETGSVRKEMEWKMTLAGKLFEERRNVDYSERMDFLWETYESDTTLSTLLKNDESRRNIEKRETGDGGDITGQLCCLQALNLPAVQTNLGARKRSQARLSKDKKGLGWLHRVAKHNKCVNQIGNR